MDLEIEHPAVEAWIRLRCRDRPGPTTVTCLQERPGSAVYLLSGLGPDGGDVVAKRARAGKVAIERAIYEEVLPRIGLRGVVACHGSIEAGDEAWIFLAPADGTPYSPGDADHCRLAARWLAALHGPALKLDLPPRLPEKSPGHYRRLVESYLDSLDRGMRNLVLAPADRNALEGAAESLERLARVWDGVEAGFAESPRTLVHGDFAAKNMRVEGGELVVFDWGSAARGIPAVDLVQNEPGEDAWVGPDLELYAELTADLWRGRDRACLERLAGLGKVLFTLDVFHDVWGLATVWAGRVAPKVPVYTKYLRDGMRRAGLDGG